MRPQSKVGIQPREQPLPVADSDSRQSRGPLQPGLVAMERKSECSAAFPGRNCVPSPFREFGLAGRRALSPPLGALNDNKLPSLVPAASLAPSSLDGRGGHVPTGCSLHAPLPPSPRLAGRDEDRKEPTCHLPVTTLGSAA